MTAWTQPTNRATGYVVNEDDYDVITNDLTAIGEAWVAFTPVWTATTNPAIGNGTLVGAYKELGKLLFVRYWIKMGSTTTYGAGAWRLALPNALTASTARTQRIGMDCYDSSATTPHVGTAWSGSLAGSTTLLYLQTHGAAVGLNATTPFTWATNDELIIEGVLEVA